MWFANSSNLLTACFWHLRWWLASDIWIIAPLIFLSLPEGRFLAPGPWTSVGIRLPKREPHSWQQIWANLAKVSMHFQRLTLVLSISFPRPIRTSMSIQESSPNWSLSVPHLRNPCNHNQNPSKTFKNQSNQHPIPIYLNKDNHLLNWNHFPFLTMLHSLLKPLLIPCRNHNLQWPMANSNQSRSWNWQALPRASSPPGPPLLPTWTLT